MSGNPTELDSGRPLTAREARAQDRLRERRREQREQVRQEAGQQSDRFTVSDFEVQRRDGQFVAEPSEQALERERQEQREQARQEAAQESDRFSRDDLTTTTQDGQIVVEPTQQAIERERQEQREQVRQEAASELDRFGAEDIEVQRQDGELVARPTEQALERERQEQRQEQIAEQREQLETRLVEETPGIDDASLVETRVEDGEVTAELTDQGQQRAALAADPTVELADREQIPADDPERLSIDEAEELMGIEFEGDQPSNPLPPNRNVVTSLRDVNLTALPQSTATEVVEALAGERDGDIKISPTGRTVDREGGVLSFSEAAERLIVRPDEDPLLTAREGEAAAARQILEQEGADAAVRFAPDAQPVTRTVIDELGGDPSPGQLEIPSSVSTTQLREEAAEGSQFSPDEFSVERQGDQIVTQVEDSAVQQERQQRRAEARDSAVEQLNEQSGGEPFDPDDVAISDGQVELSEAGREKVDRLEAAADVTIERVESTRQSVESTLSQEFGITPPSPSGQSAQGEPRQGEAAAQDARAEARGQLSENVGVDLSREDVEFEQDGDTVTARLSDEGERQVARERAPLQNTPAESVTETGAELRARFEQATDPFAESFREATPNRDDVFGPVEDATDSLPSVPLPSSESVAAGATAAVAAPEPVTTGTGALVLGGLAAGATAASAAQRIEGDGLPAPDPTQSEIEVPEQTQQSEIDVPAEQRRLSRGELDVPETAERSEISIERGEGLQIDEGEIGVPAQTQQAIQRPAQEQRERQRRGRREVIPEEFIPDEQREIGRETPNSPSPQRNIDERRRQRELQRDRPQDRVARTQEVQEPDVTEQPTEQTAFGGEFGAAPRPPSQLPTVGPDITPQVEQSQATAAVQDVTPAVDTITDQLQGQGLQLRQTQQPAQAQPPAQAEVNAPSSLAPENLVRQVEEQGVGQAGGSAASPRARPRLELGDEEDDDEDEGRRQAGITGVNEVEFAFQPPDDDGDGFVEPDLVGDGS